MAQMLKYRPVGDVLATEVTDKNLDDLAALTKAQVFTSPDRLGGTRYIVLTTADGSSQRADVGSYIVQDGEGKRATFSAMDAPSFLATYTR